MIMTDVPYVSQMLKVCVGKTLECTSMVEDLTQTNFKNVRLS